MRGGAAAVLGAGGGCFGRARRGGFGVRGAAVLGGAARQFLAWATRRFAQPFGGALAPLGSPPCFVPGFAPCFAAVIPRAGLCAGLLCRARARIINFSLI